jgi:uncharacterized protein YPO0396
VNRVLKVLLFLALAMSIINGLGNRANAHSDIDQAIEKIESAQSNLDDVQTHLNNADGADPDDAQSEIEGAKQSASDTEDDLAAAKAALEN